MNVFIVDDETPAREELVWLLEQSGHDLTIVGQAASAREALDAVDELGDGVDLVFLDINMPGIDGLRLAETWRERHGDSGPMVVFVTAYDDRGVQAFEVDALDYLLKPVRLERLQRALRKASKNLEEDAPGPEPQHAPLARISVHAHGVYRVVPTEDILFFESEDGIVVAQTRDERFIIDFSLKDLERYLDAEAFFRCHRSYIVQLDSIVEIAPWGAGTYRLMLDRDADIGVPLARARASELRSKIPWSAAALD